MKYFCLLIFQVGELRKCQNERLKVQFTDSQTNNRYNTMDATIESLTQTLTTIFRQSQIKVKKIETIKNRTTTTINKNDSNINDNINNSNNNFISKEERRMRLSAMRSRAKIIQKLSQDFRHLQRRFLESLVF